VTVAGVAIAGALGALARYGLNQVFGPRPARGFPAATFLINISGSFILGLLVAAFSQRLMVNTSLRTSLTVGFLGAYTTFSTFSLETVRLIEEGALTVAIAYAVGSLTLGVVAAYTGMLVGRAI
jgi:fluoride exporter